MVDLVVRLRRELSEAGLDAGPATIGRHLAHHDQIDLAPSTIARHLSAAGLVTPQPHKRPRSSYTRFAAGLPNGCGQADFTHYRLTRPDGHTTACPASRALMWRCCPGSTTAPGSPCT